MDDDEKRSASLGIRVRPSLKKIIDELAREDGRPTAQWIERLLLRAAQERGRIVQ
jgi:hypothetical protein